MTSVQWPAILKFEGDAELHYLDSAAAWPTVADLRPGDADLLIDSRGQCYHLECLQGVWGPRATQQKLDLGQLDAWVRAHLVAMQQCCVYKVELVNIAQGLQLVKDTQEQ